MLSALTESASERGCTVVVGLAWCLDCSVACTRVPGSSSLDVSLFLESVLPSHVLEVFSLVVLSQSRVLMKYFHVSTVTSGLVFRYNPAA